VDEDVLDELVRVSFAVIARLSEVAAAHDLSLTQLRVLAILRDREPRMADLASYLGLDRSSVSGLIDRAAKRDLVRRTASPDDGRSVHVALTPAGRRLARQLLAEVTASTGPMTDALSPTDQTHLTDLLRRLRP
jgi:MarR family transcriptional regulator, lower aerobic nicotinate degradation pathway regulator